MDEQNILDTTKKMLGLDADYDVFDLDILVHINSVFSTLAQLGVGPSSGYNVDPSTKWSDFFVTNDPRLNPVKTYVYLRVRMLFDPPATSFTQSAMQEQIRELEWRLMVTVDPPAITTEVIRD